MTETRTCLVCGEPVPTERQKYCSRKCMAKVNRWAARSSSAKRRQVEKQSRFGSLQGEGVRVCLGCSRRFKSRGPGNRLCKRCRPDTDLGPSVAPRAEAVRIDAGGRTRD